MTDDFQCRNELLGRFRLFAVTCNDKKLFEIQYRAIDNRDPTFDMLDLEMEDFFYWTAKTWNTDSIKADMLKFWGKRAAGA